MAVNIIMEVEGKKKNKDIKRELGCVLTLSDFEKYKKEFVCKAA